MSRQFFSKKNVFFCVSSFIFLAESASAVTLDDIYQHLNTAAGAKYLKYENITYAAPSTNYIDLDKENPWLLQTPNSWSGASHYNLSFSPISSNKVDSEFHVPTCEDSSHCQGASICQKALFTPDNRNLCLTPAYKILDNMYDLIVNAKSSVDIVTLGKVGFANRGFSVALKNALTELAKKTIKTESKITVRLLEGSYVPFTLTAAAAKNLPADNNRLNASIQSLQRYLSYLTSDFPKGNKVVVSIANMRSCQSMNCGNENDQSDIALNFSWNHAKIINVDNWHLITGGQNLWGDDYLEKDPVYDANIQISGSVSKGATIYANALWSYIDKNKGFSANYCHTYQNGKINKKCITYLPVETTGHLDGAKNFMAVKGMPISKLNNGVGVGNDADQSELARVFAFKNATRSIKISQQALFAPARNPGFKQDFLRPLGTVDGNIIESLAQAIYQNAVQVYIITSAYDGLGYSSNVPLSYISNSVLSAMASMYKISKKEARNKVSECLHLGYLSDIEKTSLQNHHKFWMVDDHLFYFGSHNFYPASLQEFGVIVDSPVAGEMVLSQFWEPLWSRIRN